jgi:hypothetical protein
LRTLMDASEYLLCLMFLVAIAGLSPITQGGYPVRLEGPRSLDRRRTRAGRKQTVT